MLIRAGSSIAYSRCLRTPALAWLVSVATHIFDSHGAPPKSLSRRLDGPDGSRPGM